MKINYFLSQLQAEEWSYWQKDFLSDQSQKIIDIFLPCPLKS